MTTIESRQGGICLTTVILAEKPDQARSYAAVFSKTTKKKKGTSSSKMNVFLKEKRF